MNHTYMVLSKEAFFEEEDKNDYRIQMLLQNNILGLLEVSQQALNGNNKLYYEISSMVSLEEEYIKKEMDYESLKELLLGCVIVYQSLEEYLLDDQQIVLTPEYIYINPETRKPKFCFYPDYGRDGRDAVKELMEYVLEKLDHTNSEAVMLGYKVYKITRNPNFTMKEIEMAVLEDKKIKKEKEEVIELQAYESFENPEETIPLVPMMKEEYTPKKVKFEKISLDSKKEDIEVEVIGMITGAAVMIVLIGILFLGIGMNKIALSNKSILYIIGGIVMSFISIIIMAYSNYKKRQVSDI